MATQTTARKKYRRKRRRINRGTRSLLFSFGILIVLGAAVLIYQAIFSKRESIVSMEATPIATTSTYLNTGDGLLYQTDGQIHFYHLTDSKQNYTYGMGASDIRMSGSESMTVVYNRASLQVVGKPEPLTFTGLVLEVECGTSHLALLRRSDEGMESVVVLTADGEQVEQLTYVDQYIVDFGFYRVSTEMLWVETLSINAGTPTTSIYTYDLSKNELTGMINVQSQLIDGLNMTAGSIFAVGTNQIIRYTHDGNKEVYRSKIYGYRVADFSAASGTPTFLMTPRGGDFHSVKLLTLEEASAANAVETYLQIPSEGVAAFIMGSRLVVASREQVFTYTLKGKLSKTATFEQPIDDAVKLTDSILLLSSNGTYFLARIA